MIKNARGGNDSFFPVGSINTKTSPPPFFRPLFTSSNGNLTYRASRNIRWRRAVEKRKKERIDVVGSDDDYSG